MNSLSERELNETVAQLVHACRQPLTRASGLLSLAQLGHSAAPEDLRDVEEALKEIDSILQRALKVAPTVEESD